MNYEEYDSLIMSEDNENLCYIADMDTYELLHITKACMRLYGMNSPEEYLGKNAIAFYRGWTAPAPSAQTHGWSAVRTINGSIIMKSWVAGWT